MSYYIRPESIISSSLDKRSPEFRVAHVRYFQKLKQENVLMLDKALYHTANASSLGVKLRIFQRWFIAYEQDFEKIAEREEFSDDEESDEEDEGHYSKKMKLVNSAIEENRRSKSS